MAQPVQPASKVVNCCHCQGPVRVSLKAISVCCPHCQQRVALETVVVTTVFTGRSLITCGDVIVEPNGRVNTPIQAQNVIVRGVVRAPVVALSRLVVEGSGRIHGDVQARHLDVAEGGVIAGACKIAAPRAAATAHSTAGPSVIGDPQAAPSTMPRTVSASVAPVLPHIPDQPIRKR
jgi:cytoskeletal protein CcmA (bactofilin family)